MKKLIAALLSSVWVLSLSACNSVYVTENVNLTVSETTESNSTDATEEYSATSTVTTQLDDTEISPLDLLNYYIDEEGCYRVDQNKIKATDNYDLFRKYFFGTWNGRFCYADEKTEQESLIIDDSLNSYNMTNPGICFVGMFYEVEDHVLAFITGGIEGSCFINEYSVLHNNKIYTPEWLYNHTTAEYMEAGLSNEEVLYVMEKMKDLPFTPEAKKAIENKYRKFRSLINEAVQENNADDYTSTTTTSPEISDDTPQTTTES